MLKRNERRTRGHKLTLIKLLISVQRLLFHVRIHSQFRCYGYVKNVDNLNIIAGSNRIDPDRFFYIIRSATANIRYN